MITTTDDLPITPVDGQIEILKVSSGTESAIYIELEYIAERDKWVAREELMVSGLDQTGHVLEATNVDVKQYTPFYNHPLYSWDYLTWHKCDVLGNAGLRLEYRQAAWLKGVDSFPINVGCYFYSYDIDDWNSPDGSQTGYTTPPSGGWAETDYVSGGADNAAVGESGREYVESEWLPLLTINRVGSARPPRDVIYPAIYGFMDEGAEASGLIIGYQLWLRWVANPPTESPPAADWMALMPADVTWYEITDIRAGWSALENPFEPFACAIIGPFLAFRGGISGPSVSDGTVLFALPTEAAEGASPPGSVRRITPDTNGTQQGAMNIADDGTVKTITGGGDSFYVFDNCIIALIG